LITSIDKIGFGGSCHWCTEAVFQSLKGVTDVRQGWIASVGDAAAFSEAVIVEYNPEVISLETLIAIHLFTHSCTSNHTMRSKYRSAVYTFNDEQITPATIAIGKLQKEFAEPIITAVIPFKDFKINKDEYLNYYYSNPDKPFCENMINPKLKILMQRFQNEVDADKISL
jgi:peptide-methionine (S)-S-oxide reductase